MRRKREWNEETNEDRKVQTKERETVNARRRREQKERMIRTLESYHSSSTDTPERSLFVLVRDGLWRRHSGPSAHLPVDVRDGLSGGRDLNIGSSWNFKTSSKVDMNFPRVVCMNQTQMSRTGAITFVHVFSLKWYSQEISRTVLPGIASAWSLSIIDNTRRCINPRRNLTNEEKFHKYKNWVHNIRNIFVVENLVTKWKVYVTANMDPC